MPFPDWWDKAKHDFDDARATSVYRYQLPAFADLYGVDFDTITDAQAQRARRKDLRTLPRSELALPRRHRTGQHRVDVQRPVLESARVQASTTRLASWSSTSRRWSRDFTRPSSSSQRRSVSTLRPAQGLKVESLDDYLAVLDRLFEKAKWPAQPA